MKKQKEIIPLTKEDREFFRDFYQQHKNYIFREAAALTPNYAEREDLVQETLIRLMKKIFILRDLNCNKTAYYIVITIRTVYYDTLKARKGVSILPLDDETITKLLYGNAPEARCEEILEAKLAVELLRKELPERYWVALVGKYLIGYSHEELSTLLGITQGTLRVVIHRSKARAREILQKHNWIGGD